MPSDSPQGRIPPEDRRRCETLIQAKWQEAERSLAAYVRQAWRVVEPTRQYVHGWHIDAMCEHLQAVTEGQILRLLINVPPRHQKSLTVSVFWPSWVWGPRNLPGFCWLFSSYAAQLANRDAIKCRWVIESPWYQARWGDRFQLAGDQNAIQRYTNTLRGHRIATGVGGANTGEGGDCIACDDPHNVLDAESEAIREATITWFRESMSTRCNNPNTGRIVVVGQRVAEADMSHYCLSTGEYVHLCLPAEYERPKSVVVPAGVPRGEGGVMEAGGGGEKPAGPAPNPLGWQDPRKEEGELLWPKQFSKPVLDALKRALGSHAASAQLQQRPTPRGGAAFKEAWFQYFKQTVHHFILVNRQGEERIVPVSECWKLTTVDTATTIKTHSKFTAIATFAVTPQYELLLIDMVRLKLEAPDIPGRIRGVVELHKPRMLGIEPKSSGIGVIQTLTREGLTIIELKAETDKFSRTFESRVRMERGQIYFPFAASWLEDFKTELLQFSPAMTHEYDDQVDVLAHAAIVVNDEAMRGSSDWAPEVLPFGGGVSTWRPT